MKRCIAQGGDKHAATAMWQRQQGFKPRCSYSLKTNSSLCHLFTPEGEMSSRPLLLPLSEPTFQRANRFLMLSAESSL